MTPVIFINCGKIPFIEWIIRGKKKYETRNRNTLKQLVGKRVLIAETGHGKPRIRCSAFLKHGEFIDNYRDWEYLRPETCIPVWSEYEMEYPGKWIYELADVREVNIDWKEGKRHGRVWMELECDFDVAVALMDDEIREQIHADLAPCTEAEFMAEYRRRHEQKYNEPFVW